MTDTTLGLTLDRRGLAMGAFFASAIPSFRMASTAVHAQATPQPRFAGHGLFGYPRRLVFAAAMMVEPEPEKLSSTMSPRFETSRIASARSPTGFGVG
jgi:hypothetical protein